MPKITGYATVARADRNEFHNEIFKLLQEGWEPQGSVTFSGGVYLQAMVKVDRSEENDFQTIIADQINDIHTLCVIDLQHAVARWIHLNT